MNRRENLFVFLVCFLFTSLLTAEAIIPEIGLAQYIFGAFLTALTFVFIPVRAFIFGVNKIRVHIKNGRKVKESA